MRSPLWSIPISSRTTHTPLLHTVSFILLFNGLILVIFSLLVVLFPLRLISRRLKVWHQSLGKSLFGKSLVIVMKIFFRRVEFIVSKEGGGGSEDWVDKDDRGRITGIKVPKQSIWVANHQTLADWLFLWTFFYFTESSPSLYIALKSSLKSIPIIGTACGWFGFAFLERNWAKDKVNFEKQLEGMARDARNGGEHGQEGKLDFLLFPEGTIVTENTRGISSKYAEKAKLKDFNYTLLPRSTGLFFALRQLAIRLPNLELTDLTIGYPLPRKSSSQSPLYPSEFYSLPSIFIYNVPPPVLHFHLRHIKVSEIPLGDLRKLKEEGKGEGDDGTEEERKQFEEWLLKLWGEKDQLLKRFNETGSFVDQTQAVADSRVNQNDHEEEEEEEERVKGEIAWKPRLRSPVSDTIQFIGILATVAVLIGWGFPAVWKTGLGVGKSLFGGSTQETVGVSCGCGKMKGMGLDLNDRLEL